MGDFLRRTGAERHGSPQKLGMDMALRNGCAVPYGCRYWVGIISIKMDLVKGIRFAYGRGKFSLSSSTRWHMPGMLSPWKDVTGDSRAPVPQNSTLLK